MVEEQVVTIGINKENLGGAFTPLIQQSHG
jgi:hypothetical protein